MCVLTRAGTHCETEIPSMRRCRRRAIPTPMPFDRLEPTLITEPCFVHAPGKASLGGIGVIALIGVPRLRAWPVADNAVSSAVSTPVKAASLSAHAMSYSAATAKTPLTLCCTLLNFSTYSSFDIRRFTCKSANAASLAVDAMARRALRSQLSE